MHFPKRVRMFVSILSIFLPWPLKRALLRLCGYRIHPSARIGFSLILVDKLEMAPHSSIRHFVLMKGVDRVAMGAHSIIGNFNTITGLSLSEGRHHLGQDRVPELVVGDHSGITFRHLLDCTNRIAIGKFTTIAGYHTQMLTHSVDLAEGVQSSKPITVGDYCFLGTNCTVLGGAVLPNCSVLGAKALLREPFTEEWSLYAGVPAKRLAAIPRDWKYFTRTTGHVY